LVSIASSRRGYRSYVRGGPFQCSNGDEGRNDKSFSEPKPPPTPSARCEYSASAGSKDRGPAPRGFHTGAWVQAVNMDAPATTSAKRLPVRLPVFDKLWSGTLRLDVNRQHQGQHPHRRHCNKTAAHYVCPLRSSNKLRPPRGRLPPLWPKSACLCGVQLWECGQIKGVHRLCPPRCRRPPRPRNRTWFTAKKRLVDETGDHTKGISGGTSLRGQDAMEDGMHMRSL